MEPSKREVEGEDCSDTNKFGREWCGEQVGSPKQVSAPQWYDTVDMHVHDASVAARCGLESELETFCLRHSTDLTISVAQN